MSVFWDAVTQTAEEVGNAVGSATTAAVGKIGNVVSIGYDTVKDVTSQYAAGGISAAESAAAWGAAKAGAVIVGAEIGAGVGQGNESKLTTEFSED